jgi:hypothetical protein
MQIFASTYLSSSEPLNKKMWEKKIGGATVNSGQRLMTEVRRAVRRRERWRPGKPRKPYIYKGRQVATAPAPRYCLAAEKNEAAIYSDRGLFDHNREMMKQAYLIMKTFAAPGANTSQQRLRGGLYQI